MSVLLWAEICDQSSQERVVFEKLFWGRLDSIVCCNIVKWQNSVLTFGRIANIVAAAINGPVLLSWVTVLVATLSVEGGEISADIPETVSVRDDIFSKRIVVCHSS